MPGPDVCDPCAVSKRWYSLLSGSTFRHVLEAGETVAQLISRSSAGDTLVLPADRFYRVRTAARSMVHFFYIPVFYIFLHLYKSGN